VEFDFLPKLPNSNLDDRTFQDLVDECILRIPRYCPEWTDYNASDPGITLIELFSWLTDQMLLRFNQVPRRNYVAFLELLGIRLQPPAPAQTDLTFYLTNALPEAYCVPPNTEVATERTQTDEAIVFSTDRPLWIGKPILTHFLTAQTLEDAPQALRDRVTDLWTREPNGQWQGSEQPIFDEQPQPGNSFYLVLDPEQPLDGNVLAITLKGAAATPTGINPNFPPRRWEAWNGERWQSVLLGERDDKTRGFSFSEMAQQGQNPVQGADVTLHLPQRWPVTRFTTYQGRWLRCVYTIPAPNQPGYGSSPRIIGLAVRAIGGTVGASNSTQVRHESLGTSDGTPGQTFQLQGAPILARRDSEYVLVTPPGGLPQTWKEVTDFADSGPEDLHYTLDSLTGTVQFGPLIREPVQLKQQTQIRLAVQQQATAAVAAAPSAEEISSLERQYGAVPPRGATLVMVSYRLGGGRRGNVQPGSLKVLKSAVPYISRVLNHIPARNGADAESLDQAVLRAPQMLRTRDRAVTPEDFETLAQRAAGGAVARVRCLPAMNPNEAGTVRLLVIPQSNTDLLKRGEGMNPELFTLRPQLQQQILGYLNERKLLGVQVQLQEPEYVGVQVQTEVGLQPEYNNPRAQQEVLFNLRMALYRYLNPLVGGADGKGWPFGRPVYPSDIVALLQQTPGVLYLGAVLLFVVRKRGENWVRKPSPDPMIDPGPLGLVCSWADNRLRSSHVINPLGGR
jgi:predicted phage baseplate assembly protein